MREYALVLAIAAAVTYLLTPLAGRLALLTGTMAEVRDRDVHAVPVPRLGGLAMFGGVLAALVVAARLPALQVLGQDSTEPLAIGLASAVIVLVGALDDRFGLDAMTKLAGQVLAAGVMVLFGVQLLYLPNPFAAGEGYIVLGPQLGVPLTVLLVVVTINAVNFVDGLDGLAAGVVGIAALAFFVYAYQLSVVYGLDRLTPAALAAIALVGICGGFLPHNFFPARLFMGDSGSMLIGLLLSAATIGITGRVDPSAVSALDLFPVLLPVLLPVAVIAVPFFDLLLAVVRRTRSRRSPFAPDKLHLHHRLLKMGHSQPRAVLIMYCWSALLGFGAVGIALAAGWGLVIGFVVATAAGVVLVGTLSTARA